MKLPHLIPVLLLALPLAAQAQTKPAAQQVTEVTEELDPSTGKVIKRTTRTYAEPVGTATGTTSSATKVVTKTAVPAGTSPTTTTTTSATPSASDATVSDFLREKIVVSRLDAPGLISAYGQFMDKVRADRAGWNAANWEVAAAVMSALNTRYEQLRTGAGFSTDDKVTIRSQQVEFQALRTARRVTEQITDKL
jgi:hypothetical protein